MARTKAATSSGMPACVWRYDGRSDAWDTDCGHTFQFLEGGPKANGLVYCGYCGRILKGPPGGGE